MRVVRAARNLRQELFGKFDTPIVGDQTNRIWSIGAIHKELMMVKTEFFVFKLNKWTKIWLMVRAPS